MNHKKLRRLYAEKRLGTPSWRAQAGARHPTPMVVLQGRTSDGPMDFVSDALTDAAGFQDPGGGR